jgi:hypothetical protein
MPFLLAGLRKNASLLRFHVESESKLFSPATNLKKRQMRWRLGCGNWNSWVTRHISFAAYAEEASASWCLASCAGNNTPDVIFH